MMYIDFAVVQSLTRVVQGQNGYIYDRLSDYCDSGVSFASLSFINRAPEHDNATGYPGTGFAAHCGGDYYYKNGHKSGLLSNCATIKEDISYCQARGIKVLMSIGGEWSDDFDYRVSTEKNGRSFAEFLWKAFGPYDPSWDGPRPFDTNTTHNAVDGFDFDIEQPFGKSIGFSASQHIVQYTYSSFSLSHR